MYDLKDSRTLGKGANSGRVRTATADPSAASDDGEARSAGKSELEAVAEATKAGPACSEVKRKPRPP
jgi:hypothetical protein